MTRYRLSFPHRHRQFIHFDAEFQAAGDTLHLQLPAWRPGRYELGNFAKSIRGFELTDSTGHPLAYQKATKDLWVVDTQGTDTVKLKYLFYANTLNAGSTWLDDEQVYVNPVNCFFYDANHQEAPFEVALDLPASTPIACQLHHENAVLFADNVQELMDAPFIASDKLQHRMYDVGSETYHIWIMGEVRFDLDRFVREHAAFTAPMVEAFGDIPVEDYHFMYQVPRFPARHGVEHSRSTVIALGPHETLEKEEAYRELMGIACHELYHTWNIKAIRPADMQPYDFSRENYSELGYVCEGVTTWFGDEFLHRSGVFDDAEFAKRLAQLVQRHLWNDGRFNLSVAESSWDTWLDGYVRGIPWRKVSIYNEGALITFILDTHIRQATNGNASMDNVMRLMYEEFGKTGKGYSATDYRRLIEQVSGTDVGHIFDGLIYGTEDYLPHIKAAFTARGWNLTFSSNTNPISDHCGLIIHQDKIEGIIPNGPADVAGLWYGDHVLSTEEHSEHWTLKAKRHGRTYEVDVLKDVGYYQVPIVDLFK